MSWAAKRQFEYLSGLILFVGLVVFLSIYPILFKAPTCTDGKQNGTEVGVDCGGACLKMCLSQVREPVVLWSRAFPLTNNYYNLVALVENQNKDSVIKSIDYEFKVYDNDNVIIGIVKGSTFVPSNQQFAILEPRFDAGLSKVHNISFEFTGSFDWVKKVSKLETIPVFVDNIIYDDSGNFPILNARVKNDSIYDLSNFDVIAILYDVNHNAINASKTHQTKLLSNDKLPLIFTWPNKFDIIPVQEDVFIQVDPFSVSF